MFSINSSLIRTDTTCVKLVNKFLIAGIGGQLHVFDKSSKVTYNVIEVFDGQKIYGIVPDSTLSHCLVFGANYIKNFACDVQSNINFKEVALLTCVDWILAAKWINSDNNIVTVLMRNIVILWSKDLKPIKKIICEEKCILYSAFLANETWDDLIVLSGTVFSQILIWCPSSSSDETLCPVLCRLDGHKGVIFSIHYNPTAGLICSTSDDRSARLWTIAHKNLSVELSQPCIQISLRCSLYGHSARVFRCQILDSYVLTAGEDSFVNIWSLEGKLIRKLEAHQGACVWALDCDESNNVIATGGGNSGVSLFPLSLNISKKEMRAKGNEVPKRAAILKNNDLVTISEKGLLEYYCANEDIWIEVCRHNDLANYAVLEVSLCRNLIALAGYHGSIYIYKQYDAGLKCICKHEIADKPRIFSLHWLSSERFLTCGPEGKMCIWNLKDNSIFFTKILQLPPSKERWTTAACAWNDKYISVGNRKGNLYLYSSDSVDPIQTIRKAHNYLGVTYLNFKNNQLLSMGRNSVVKKYHFDQSLEQLLTLSSNKLPFNWLASMCEDVSTILLAFLGNEFVLYDLEKRRTLWQFNCGGGHRCWDFYKNTNNVNFLYIKDKNVNIIQFNWNLLLPADIVDGYHVNEINGASCINFPQHNKCLFISGGEDTTMQISTLGFKNNKVTFTSTDVLKSHLSSIRVIKSCKISESCETGKCVEKHLVFSAGGRAQIVLWELQVNLQGSGDISVVCGEKYSYYEQLQPEDSETRVMDLCTIIIKKYVVLVAACSDGTLKIFLIIAHENKSAYEIFMVGSVSYKLKCILKVSHLQICCTDIILSMSTNGKIVFWDFTKFINNLSNSFCCDEIKDEMVRMPLDFRILHSVQVHQSGINSFHYKMLTSNKCLFLTGGDDNAIFVNLFHFTDQAGKLCIQHLSKFHDFSSHCAQITGVFLTNDYFFTTSVDQKLNVFKWNVKNDELQCSYVQKYNSSVADIQGMQCFENDGAIYAILYGNGIELCKIGATENLR